MKILVLDPDPSFRVGVVSSAAAMAEIEVVTEAATVAEALHDGALASADVVLVDLDVTPDVLGDLLRGISRVAREGSEPRHVNPARLTAREQEVLRLVAEGHPTREVARRLCYSERTIKNVVHAVVKKLNARTRSQAVAEAVRAGLI
jgi:DNA-binding NarL/FixJ family response regulator